MTRILYVEDNDDNVYMLKMRFELLNGYEVFTAADGEAGCTMAVTEQPDVILMDLDLPVVDGWEATRRLKQDQATRHVDRYSLNQRYRGRQRVYLQAMRSPHLYTKVACTAKRNFDHECKKTFATKSARSGLMQCSKVWVAVGMRVTSRPPAQIRTCSFPAYGSYLG